MARPRSTAHLPHSPARGAPSKPKPPRRPTLPPLPPLSLTHPAFLIAACIGAAAVLLSVSFRISDPDIWEHLAVGRALWRLRSIPMREVWTWPTFDAPQVLPSWGFRLLLWPFYAGLGVWGLYAWRWATTLAAFGFLWAAARRMGARGLVPPAVLVLASLTYRQRSQVRPETLVIVLLALEVWLLEVRRSGGPDRSWWLVPLVWLWSAVHLSFVFAFAVLAAYAVHELIVERRIPRRLLVWGAVALAATFVNPFGASAVWEPVRYALHGGSDPIYGIVLELLPWDWRRNATEGTALLVLGWPLLILARARRRPVDVAEIGMCLVFTWLGVTSRRFLGFHALVAAPFVSRDLTELLARVSRPAWLRSPAARAALVSAGCIAIGLPEWRRTDRPLGVGLDERGYPTAACDFMAQHGVRGHGFNPFHLGGYLLWRFWPDRSRLPFIDVHQTGTARDRALYAAAIGNARAWHELDDERRFDYALLDRRIVEKERLMDFLDADSTWALVFEDDDAALFLRRGGALTAVADSFAYREWPAGPERLGPVVASFESDGAFRARALPELERQVVQSRRTAMAHSLLAAAAFADRDLDGARAHLDTELAIDPRVPDAHRGLGSIALAQGHPRDALAEFRRERALHPTSGSIDFSIGVAARRCGDLRAASAAFRREVALHPDHQEARDSLAAIAQALRR